MDARTWRIWSVVQKKSNAVALTEPVCRSRTAVIAAGRYGTLVEQAAQAGPRDGIEHGEHVECLAGAPPRARVTVPHQQTSQRTHATLDVLVGTLKVGQDGDEPSGDEQAHVLVQHLQTTRRHVSHACAPSVPRASVVLDVTS